MEQIHSQDVQAWVQKLFAAQTFLPPPAEIYAHLGTCPLCRGALFSLAVTAPRLFPAIKSFDPSTYEDQLLRFIDDEQEEPGRGIRNQPDFWWYVVCTPSAAWDVERMLTFDLEAVASTSESITPERFPGWLAESHFHPMQRQRVATFDFSREFLQMALPARRPNFAYRGTDQNEHRLIHQRAPQGYETTIHALQQPDRQWSLQVRVKPVIIGSALIQLGSLECQAPFNRDGLASVPDIPEELLIGDDGPNLGVAIEQDVA